MRLPGAGLAALATLLALGAAPAVATPVSGSIERVGGNVIRISVTNTGSAVDLAVAVHLPAGINVVTASRVSGPPANCSPDADTPNRILCLFDPDPGFAPGATIVIEVLTNPRLPDNAGAEAYSCGIPCNTSMMSGPYAITGPPPQGPAADLGVEMRFLTHHYEVSRHTEEVIEYDLLEGRRGVWGLLLAATTTNHGPDAAADAALTLRPSGLPFGTRAASVRQLIGEQVTARCELVRGAVEPAPALCRYATFPSGADSQVRYLLTLRRPGDMEVKAEVAAATPDPNPSNNSAVFRDAIDEFPESDFGTYLRSTNKLRGKGKGGVAVFIGVLVLEDGARLGEPAADGAAASGRSPVADPAAAGCRWLTSVRGRFRRESGRNCNEPSFIRARVRRGRWSIKLRRALPRGRYTVITQAVSRDGLLETGVGRKLGNLSTFRVR